jgi:hypothetical protein
MSHNSSVHHLLFDTLKTCANIMATYEKPLLTPYRTLAAHEAIPVAESIPKFLP